MKVGLLGWMERAERVVYSAVGLALIVGAVVYLVYTVVEAAASYATGQFPTATLQLFDRLLLVLMLAQIVYTTLAYLRLGQLQVEPVLVVGIIAVVRRILVVTAVMGGTLEASGTAALTFRQQLLELALLALTALALAISMHLLRLRPAPRRSATSGEGEEAGAQAGAPV